MFNENLAFKFFSPFISINMRVTETSISCLPHTPRLEIKPTTATWIRALNKNRTHNPLVYGMRLQLTEPYQPERKFSL